MTGPSQGRGPKSPFISPSSGPIQNQLEPKIQTPTSHPFLTTLFPPPYLSGNFLFPLLPSLKKWFGSPSQDCRFGNVAVSSHPTTPLLHPAPPPPAPRLRGPSEAGFPPGLLTGATFSLFDFFFCPLLHWVILHYFQGNRTKCDLTRKAKMSRSLSYLTPTEMTTLISKAGTAHQAWRSP